MKLKRIELQGFKSFLDRTVLEFDEGITAVLGPNGCGKSNVVDAVRWVLGEQSAKTLRGDRMDDVIFKGTVKRKPVGLAEVTVTFSNEEGRLPVDFTEVAIKRRVTRDGTSDYFLNGSPCRLKDLRDLLWDSGVNNTSYSIIEESMIRQILVENNQELRRLLEEGSGITKYKARRKETQRKLDRTSQDLLRLDDIVEEIGKEVRSLQYQVGKARRHQRLFREIRALDLLLARRRRGQLDQREHELKDRTQELQTMAEADSGELGELRSRIEQQKPLIDEREAERRLLEESLQAFEEELQNHERDVAVLEQRAREHERRAVEADESGAEATRRQQEITDEIEAMARRVQKVETELHGAGGVLADRAERLQVLEDDLTRDRTSLEEAVQLNLQFIETDASQRSHLREFQIKRENRQERVTLLEEERTQLHADVEEVTASGAELRQRRDALSTRRRDLLSHLAQTERRITDLEAQAQDQQQDLATVTGRREATAGRLELLQQIQSEFQGYGEGARHVLEAHVADPRVEGGVGDQLGVPDKWTAAFETLLGEVLDAVVVDGAATAASLSTELRDGRHGLASFLWSFETAIDPVNAPPGTRLAADEVTGARLPYLQRLLARTVLCESDDQALATAHDHTGEPPLVCLAPSGLLVASDGLVRGGAGERGEVSLLGRGEKLEALQAELAGLDRDVAGAQQKLATCRREREELVGLLRQGREDLGVLDGELGETQVAVAQLEDRRRVALHRRDELAGEGERLQTEIQELAQEEEALHDRLSESGRQRESSTLQRDELRQRVQEREQERDELRLAVEEMRLTQQKREGERREVETALAHLRQQVTELAARQERLQQEAAHNREEAGQLGTDLQTRRDALMTQFEDRERRRQVVRRAQEAIQELHDQTAQWHDRVKAIEDQRSGCRDQIHQLETELATLDLRRNNLEERVEEQYSGSFADLIAAVEDDHLPKDLEIEDGVFQVEQADEILQDRRQKLASLGPINHLALEEYEAKKERLDFLTEQREDVMKAKEDLEKAIAEINRTARRLFTTTFEEVRRNYIAVFQTLFKGGRADLQLVRTDDPLESHIHITAQPTGKIIDHVSLLSGGERCLTALSILFAVYLVKPSPFCLLDEADAPLDDTNIGRFVTMLREFSKNTQFLVITHNKLTMETANHLYGVTMMEQGVSSVVSVSFRDVAETQSDQELAGAIVTARGQVDRVEEERQAAVAAATVAVADDVDEVADGDADGEAEEARG